MLNQLIESKTHSNENFRRGNFILTTLFTVALLLSGAMIYSLYAKTLDGMNENLDVASLVAPIAETDAPQVEPPKSEPHNVSNSKVSTEIIRVVNQQNLNETPKIPIGISIVKNQYASRPAGQFQLGAVDSDPNSSNSGNAREAGSGNSSGISTSPKQSADEDEETKEPPKMPKTEVKPPSQKIIASLGVANGKATFLPVPAYPLAAKAVHAQGAVNVQIMLDETGRVVSAKAVSGHPLLRQAAEQAAQRAVFSPTKLSNVPVKATGVIVYNFVPQ